MLGVRGGFLSRGRGGGGGKAAVGERSLWAKSAHPRKELLSAFRTHPFLRGAQSYLFVANFDILFFLQIRKEIGKTTFPPRITGRRRPQR